MVNTIKLKIFNSISLKKELFTINAKEVGIYVCGITPYDITHLGHAFVYVFFDALIRYLEYLGYSVKYIQNITDVDDDLLRKARELNIDYKELSEKNFEMFLKDLKWLNIRLPDFFPKATNHIQEIISLNKILEAKGFAYQKNGNLYFDISRDKKYGKLSRLSKTAMLPISIERGNFANDANKKDPLDFVLWQKSAKDEPFWKSPWSEGRPGWHIECSSMSMKYLGNTIDIHGGGEDLIYPHHESEIAQSEKAGQKPFVRYFMHTAMLYHLGQKMSKSLGNMIFIKDLKKKYSANEVRILLLNQFYRQKWEFKENLLKESRKLNQLLMSAVKSKNGKETNFDYANFEASFYKSLDDDINTPRAIKVLISLAEKILKSKDQNTSPAKKFLLSGLNILGLSY